MCLGVLSNFFSSYPLEVVSQTYVGFSGCLVLCGGLFGVFFLARGFMEVETY